MKPGEDFEDSGELHDSRMEEERRHWKIFPELRYWSKHHTRSNPMHQTLANPTVKTHTNPAHQRHTNSTNRTHPTKTYDPPPRSEKAKTGENCIAFLINMTTFEWLDSDQTRCGFNPF